MARLAISLAGAGIGFLVGGPTGARIGWFAGTVVGGLLLRPPTQRIHIPGPQLPDAQAQTSQEGVPLPIGWGLWHVAGNVIQAGPLNEVTETTTTTQKQGKGGGGGKIETTTTTTRRFRTFAIGLGRSHVGAISGVLRIWEFDKLVYDVRSSPDIPLEDTEAFGANLRFYLGGEGQLPDPELETISGVGTTPAYRGLAYVVFIDKEMTDFGGIIPQYRFEVFRGVPTDDELFDAQFTAGDVGDTSGNYYLADWSRRRYFMFDAFGDDQGFKRFNLDTNVQNDELLLSSITTTGTTASAGISEATGHIYYGRFTGLNTYTIDRIDPDLKQVLATLPLPGGHFFFRAAVFNFNGVDWLLTAGSGAVGNVRWIHVRNTANLQAVASLDGQVSQLPVVARKLERGYVVTVTGTTSGPSGNVIIYRATAPDDTAHPVLEISSTVTPSAILAHWTRLADIARAFVDDSDNNLVFRARGGGDASTPMDDILVKVNPETGAVIWVINPFTFLSGGFTHHLTVANGQYLVRGPGTANISIVDTVAGTMETRAFTGFDGPAYGAQDGESVTSSQIRVLLEHSNPEGFFAMWLDRIVPAPVTLAQIVGDISDMVDVPETNPNALSDVLVRGYVAAGEFSATDALRGLQQAYYFDLAEMDAALLAVKRGANTVGTIKREDLLVGENNTFSTAREQGVEFPRKFHITWAGAEQDYMPAKMTSERRSPDLKVVTEVNLEFPINYEADEVARTADILHKQLWAELEGTAQLSLDESWAWLAPSDAVFVELFPGILKRMRITSVLLGPGFVRIDALTDRQSAYVSTVEAPPRLAPFVPLASTPGKTDWEYMDLPALITAHDTLHYYVAGKGATSAWRGAVLQRLVDGEWQNEGVEITFAETMGTLQAAVGTAREEFTDGANTILVALSEPVLSVTRTQVLKGRSAAAIGSDGDGWEIIQYQDVVEEGDNFRLSTLTRGRLNTPVRAHAVGERFVALNLPVLVPTDVGLLGTDLTLRAPSAGTFPESGTPRTVSFTGRSQTEWAPTRLRATRDVGVDWYFTWTPRHRLGNSANPVQSSKFLGWRLKLTVGGTTVVKDLTVAEFTYSVAAQTADFGAEQAGFDVQVMGRNAITGEGDVLQEAVP